ncbi:hypothetical protein [Brevibacillus reuszeri]|uniref:hypothetical protein n=1 Tax=Brevibacillus reuszeri TaxID=54915 RepID=UPI003D259CB7
MPDDMPAPVMILPVSTIRALLTLQGGAISAFRSIGTFPYPMLPADPVLSGLLQADHFSIDPGASINAGQ